MKADFGTSQESLLRRQAAEWLVRRDRGLSAAESIEFELWLADDERHAAALERARLAWSLLDRIPDAVGQQTQLRPFPRRRRRVFAAAWIGLGLAAAVTFVATPWVRTPVSTETDPSPALTLAEWESPQIVTLTDGTIVRLNAGSEVLEQYTGSERRVLLTRGEAHFAVQKDAERPFVVRAGSIEARAVGTAFNVSLQSAAVEILVTEGTVAVSGHRSLPALYGASASVGEGTVSAASVADPLDASVDAIADFLLTAQQRAVVALAPVSSDAVVVVTRLSTAEVLRALAWQEPLVRLSGATLGELALEFQRRTGYRLILQDPALAGLRIGGRFRGDDVEGFVRILEDNYGIISQPTASGAIRLTRATGAEKP